VLDPDAPGAPGSTNQVRACAQQLVGWAKERAMATLLVGHVTKEGGLAGPRTLEHVVDTVCSFEGDRHHALRLLHALKHRFGPTDELGVFEMDATGLVAVPDASALLLADRVPDAYGSAVVPILSGARPLLVEVQALASPTLGPIAARSTQGFDGSRLPLLLAVLEQRARVAVGRLDVFVNVAGGVRATESGVDLAVALAIVGAAYGLPMPATTVVVGEVGLGGEIRQVAGLERRLVEAARLGFRQAIAPASAPDVAGLDVVRVATLRDAITAALVDDVPPDPCAVAAADALLSRAGL
jgi:DNA repair protein RadA/Sms